MASSRQIQNKYLTFAEAMIAHGDGVKAAEQAGYSGKSLAVTASRLKKHPDVIEYMQRIREGLKGPTIKEKPKTKQELAKAEAYSKEIRAAEKIREQLRIETEDKRQLLWRIANDCARLVQHEETIDEYIDSDGKIVKTIRVLETVYKPTEAINAISKLNEMDGDIAAPKAPESGFPLIGGNMTIEQTLMTLIYQKA